jgi:hypothetical protein
MGYLLTTCTQILGQGAGCSGRLRDAKKAGGAWMLPPVFVNQPTEAQLALWREVAGDVKEIDPEPKGGRGV